MGRWTGGYPISNEQLPALRPTRPVLNKGRIVGQKRPLAPKHVWSIRVHLEMSCNRRDLALFNTAIDSKLRGCDLVRVCRTAGYPKTIRVDQGSEFISRDMDLWAYQRGVVLDFSRPGKPTDNAFIEAFNGRFRAECLNQHWFLTLADAAEKLEAWRRYYNEERPHGAIGNKVPIMLAKSGGVTSPSP